MIFSDPNTDSRYYPPAVSVWPRFSVTDQKFIYFNTSRSYTIGKGLRPTECVYWEKIVDGHLEPSGGDGYSADSDALTSSSVPLTSTAFAPILCSTLVCCLFLFMTSMLSITSTDCSTMKMCNSTFSSSTTAMSSNNSKIVNDFKSSSSSSSLSTPSSKPPPPPPPSTLCLYKDANRLTTMRARQKVPYPH